MMIARWTLASEPGLARQLIALQQRAYEVETSRIGASDAPPLSDTEADLLIANERWVVIEFDGAVRAAASIERRSSCLLLTRLMVDPLHLHQGLGRRLLEAIVARGDCIEVATTAANRPARNLYESMSFRFVESLSTDDGIELVRYRFAAT